VIQATAQRQSPLPQAGRLPDFLIIGAAKSGTTTLYAYLGRHPRIFMSTIKEPEFFALDSVYDRGLDWYTSLFKDAAMDQLCGEASTAYTRWPQLPEAAPRIARVLPNARLIYVMRHPIERAYSHYVHRVTRELYPHQPIRWTFEEHVRRDPMCLDGSRYLEQIERYTPFFPRESFLFLLMEDLNKKPVETLRRVWQFLGIDEITVEDTDLKSNESREIREGRIRRYTTSPVRAIPGVGRLTAVLPRSWKNRLYTVLHRSPYGRWVERRHTPPPMLPQTRAKLVEQLRTPNDRLADFLGRDLSHWNR